MAPTDRELLSRWAEAQDAEAFRQLTLRHGAMVYSVSRRILGDAVAAEDVTQECFQRLAFSSKSDMPRSLAAWLFRVATNVSLKRVRAETRRRAREIRAVAARTAREPLARDELREQVDRAIAGLPEGLREALVRHFIEGRTHKAIARELGVSRTTVTYRIQKAVERVRETLRRRGVLVAAVTLPALLGGTISAGALPAALRADLARLAVAGTGRAASTAVTALPILGGLVVAKNIALSLALALAAVALWLSLAGFLEAPAPKAPAAAPPDVAPLAARPIEPTPPAQEAEPPEGTPAARQPPPRAIVRGVVVDADELLPVAEARVRLVGTLDAATAAALGDSGYDGAVAGQIERETVAAADGAFEFRDVLPAAIEFRLYAEADGLVQCWPPLAKVEPGATLEREVRVCARLRLHGRVISSEGFAIAEAEVLVSDGHVWACERPRVGSYKAFVADGRGRFDTGYCIARQSGPPPVAVRARGFATKLVKIEWSEFVDGELELEVLLHRARRATLTVSDLDGNPLEGAMVIGQGLIPRDQTTGHDGTLALEHLREEVYSLVVRKDGYFSASVELDTRATPDASIAVRLRPLTPPVRGRILFEESLSPPASVGVDEIWIALELQDATRARTTGSLNGEALEYVFHPRQPGVYRVVLSRPFDGRSDAFYYEGTEEMEVDVHVRLEPPYVRGIVVDEVTGETLAGVSIRGWITTSYRGSWHFTSVVNGFPFPLPLSVDPPVEEESERDGRFAIVIPPPFRSESIELRLRAGSSRLGWSNDLVLTMGSRSEIEDVVLALGRPGSIGGMVVDGRGEPQRLVSVAAYDGESRVEEAVTDDGGRYRIDGLRAGDYLVLPLGRDTHGFSSRDGATDLDGIGSPREFFERPVRVESGAVTRIDLDTDRDSLGAIEGVVFPPRDGMVVRCACVVEGRPRRSPPFGRKTRVEKGRFAFSHLLPGEYRIWLEAHDDLAPPGFDGAATEGVHGAEATAWIHRARTTRVELRGPEE